MVMASPSDTPLLGCPTCGWAVRQQGSEPILPTHHAGSPSGPPCFGVGERGVSLGPRYWYRISAADHGAVIEFAGEDSSEQVTMPHDCDEGRVPVPLPPAGAFSPSLRIHVRCTRCDELVRLGDLEVGPSGHLRRRLREQQRIRTLEDP